MSKLPDWTFQYLLTQLVTQQHTDELDKPHSNSGFLNREDPKLDLEAALWVM